MSDWVPNPPCLSDKLADWEILAVVGGEDLIRGKDVLDIGPENGLDALVFASKARRYAVLDNSRAVLDRVGVVAPTAEQVEADATKRWPLADSSFDLVLDFSSLDDAGDLFYGYAEAVRVLRPGGVLVSLYANAAVLGGGPHRSALQAGRRYSAIEPARLVEFFDGLGVSILWRSREEKARAAIAVRKGR